jgi:hypothetical protein
MGSLKRLGEGERERGCLLGGGERGGEGGEGGGRMEGGWRVEKTDKQLVTLGVYEAYLYFKRRR